jgi:hypothetical protein
MPQAIKVGTPPSVLVDQRSGNPQSARVPVNSKPKLLHSKRKNRQNGGEAISTRDGPALARRSDIHVRPATFGTLRLPSMLSDAMAAPAPLATRQPARPGSLHYRRTQVFLAVVSLGPKRTDICPVVALIATKTFAEPRQRPMIWEFAHIEGARRATFSTEYLQRTST